MVPDVPCTLLLVPTAKELQILGPLVVPLLTAQPCVCGFGPIVAAARAAQLIAERCPARVLLVGIAGAYVDSLSVGKAYAFEQAGCYGIGFGSGTQFRTATAMGWSPWPAADDNDSIGDLIELHVPIGLPADAVQGLLLTVTSAASEPDDCIHRRELFPAGMAEDMEAFGVAVACKLSGVPLTVVRGISNHAGERNKDNWQVEAALHSAASLVSHKSWPNDAFAMHDNRVIRLAISTCPNDTFAFHALMTREVDWRGLEFDVQLLDISQLNQGLLTGQFDVAKASFHAAVLLADETVVLPCGSALGFGVGPLLLSAQAGTCPNDSGTMTLCPGEQTTATMLFRMFYGRQPKVRHVVFSKIMPALQQKTADFGVCIHEGRFTWQDQGLHLVEDFGTRWEKQTHLPLPLGGILARKQLAAEIRSRVVHVIHDSIRWGLDHREATLPTMRTHAQEFSDDVLFQHVDLYVNDWTLDLGETGRQALNELSRRAQSTSSKAGMLTIVDHGKTPS